MPLTSFYTDNSIPVFPREPAVGVLTEGADLHAHEPIVLIPFDDQGVASGFNRLLRTAPWAPADWELGAAGGTPAGCWSTRAGTKVSGVAERGRVIEASNEANEARGGEARPSQRQ